MTETTIIVNKKTIGKHLKGIEKWQKDHEVKDIERFNRMNKSIKKLPTTGDMSKAVSEAVNITVNGKIDSIQKDMDGLRGHLTKQDESSAEQAKVISEMNDKIKPVTNAQNWIVTAGKIIMYLGGISLAIIAIYKVLETFKN